MFATVNARLQRRLDEDLQEQAGLSLYEIEVLYQLVSAPGNRLRMAELATRLVFTRSGVSRLVDRLEREGWVERQRCELDGRGVYTLLTQSGFQAFETAAVAHVAAIRRLFLDNLSGEQATMRALLERLQTEPR